jgi:outer membrane receptor protein involved in Fe transport
MSQYGWNRNTLAFNGGLAHTARYLDPPVEENFTNSGRSSSLSVHFERELTGADRLGVIVRHGRASFQVPNERLQQDAGQLQDRTSRETAGQFSYQHIFRAGILADVRGLTRTLSADLSSNPLSTPMVAQQQRGFSELCVKAALAGHAGVHEWKLGVDMDAGAIHEDFGYEITDPGGFDPDTPATFTFADRRRNREQAVFVQDQMRLGGWTVNAGVRWDHYRLVVDESAVSPRIGAAWSWPKADLVVRLSYDRVFQTPAVENLLLTSSSALEELNDDVVRLPVRPSLGNFYEAGLSKRLFGRARLDVTAFRRVMTNFADDDVFLNTGVSFPITFQRARIHGTEVKLELPLWRALSGFVSYANMRGVGDLPITGGLFLGDEATSLLASTESFPVTQDQRHTARGRASVQLSPRMWVAMAASYGSGLPVEFEGDEADAVEQYGERIVDRVNLERGRIRASVSLDLSASVDVVKTPRRSVSIQADVLNLTNRLNVIDFSGLFSGTALAPPRSLAVRLRTEF